jgi:hypothetical protein
VGIPVNFEGMDSGHAPSLTATVTECQGEKSLVLLP